MRSKGEDDLLRMAGRCYEAAARPELWRTVLHQLSEALGADASCIVGFPDSAIGVFWSEGLDEMADRFMREGWYKNNERAARAAAESARKRGVLTESDLFTREELDRHPYNAELVNPSGFRWEAGGVLEEVAGSKLFFTTQRRSRRDPFDSADTDKVAALLPHLQRAAQLAIHINDAHNQGLLAAFEQTNTAAVLLDFQGRVIRLNKQAERYQGSAFVTPGGQCLARDKRCDAGLQRVIGYAISPIPSLRTPPPTAILRREQGRPLAVVGIPIAGAQLDIFQSAKAILLLIDPDRDRAVPETILREAFQLTPAEARLAVAIARGQDLKETAEIHRVSLGTARAQLKAIMAKTDTHRQGELVALLSRFAIVPAAAPTTSFHRPREEKP